MTFRALLEKAGQSVTRSRDDSWIAIVLAFIVGTMFLLVTIVSVRCQLAGHYESVFCSLNAVGLGLTASLLIAAAILLLRKLAVGWLMIGIATLVIAAWFLRTKDMLLGLLLVVLGLLCVGKFHSERSLEPWTRFELRDEKQSRSR